MSRETVVWTTSWPASRSASASSAWVEIGCSRDEAQDRALALAAVHRESTSVRIASAWSTSSAPTTSGGVRRSTRLAGGAGRAGPRRGRPSTTGAAGAVELRGRAGARGRAPRRRRGARRARRRAARPCARTSASSVVVDRVADGARGGARDGVAAEGRGVVAGGEARLRPRRRRAGSRSAGRSRAPSRASRGRGRTPSCSKAKNVPVRPTPVCTSSKKSSAPSSSASVRGRGERTPASAGGRRPRPGPARAGSARRRPRPRRARDVDVVRPREADAAGRAARTAARFAGWPVAESAPSVRPWNEPSSATIPGFPVALRAYLSAASIASAPELQKNACAPPKRSESRSASSAIGSVQ